MVAAFYLLTIVGLVGSYDVLYYHMYKLQLFRRREAMWENVTHFIRALLFAVMMLTVMHLDARGWWWLLYPALLTFELVNTMSDVTIEPRSRRTMGGLPHMEYVLHMLLALMTGAALASIIWGTYDLFWEPSAVTTRTLPVDWYVLAGAYSSVVIAIGMFFFELAGFVRLFRTRHAFAAHASTAVKGESTPEVARAGR